MESNDYQFRYELWATLTAAVPEANCQLVQEAFKMASTAHHGQIRKWSEQPYIWHPVRVAITVGGSYDPTWLAVALLHDVVEDCGITVDTLGRMFSKAVAQGVKQLTDRDLSFGDRKRRQLEKVNRLAMAAPQVQQIKYADWLDNWPSIRDNDPKFAELYLKEVSECLHEMSWLSPLRERLCRELDR